MIILIRQIPKDSSIYELFDFVRPAIQSWLFPEKPLIQKVEILRLHDLSQDNFEFHGLVHIDSDKAAKRAIKKLDGKVYLNQKVSVREFYPRNPRKDRRVSPEQIPEQGDKRREERRRDKSQLAVSVYKELTRRMRLLI